ncbi:helix-turn-helix domain-containing protein [Intestinimonas butyriciproducens]|uniref:helix-turn-helix domain-containing protein n=2 Tax=Intestinimonas butyriciproducens TaxID=1297617 RepID=UPI0008202574|nr:helix-turn-helix transcriptional regulator [Intestinimonas butyriciproducens]SCJ83812.1 Antitoxin PezA [uncultured Clostridium sp.]MCR1905094.1 helix-turn-helix domain-containing protein [Intestinimonas butyriciproducens]MDB7831933.1 helix-turn-helix transcriptional regulator [Intestinimonas butyriciproducens]MDB7862061.1 helix-turn-helix transcriptional regulator [Intestinimonas butyriciproducens]MDB7865064.1 helix-turn-helix transcriptional regulator [Intestinimonas butyriciproducens]
MNNRIRELRKSLHLSQTEFAREIGLKQNAISYMEKNGSTVTEQNIKAICARFHVNEDWLRSGSGNMFLEYNRRQEEFFAVFGALSPILQDYLIKTARDLLDAQLKLQSFPGEASQ